MTDEDRVRLAFRSGGRMVGPDERERCQRHPRRWTIYRWTWDLPEAGGDISGGDVEIVRGCGSCLEEDRRAADDWDDASRVPALACKRRANLFSLLFSFPLTLGQSGRMLVWR